MAPLWHRFTVEIGEGGTANQRAAPVRDALGLSRTGADQIVTNGGRLLATRQFNARQQVRQPLYGRCGRLTSNTKRSDRAIVVPLNIGVPATSTGV